MQANEREARKSFGNERKGDCPQISNNNIIISLPKLTYTNPVQSWSTEKRQLGQWLHDRMTLEWSAFDLWRTSEVTYIVQFDDHWSVVVRRPCPQELLPSPVLLSLLCPWPQVNADQCWSITDNQQWKSQVVSQQKSPSAVVTQHQ